MSRWTFYDPVALDTYVFVKNPSKMTTIEPKHRTTAVPISPVDSLRRATRLPDLPFQWSFTGRLRSKTEHDTFVNWAGRQNRIRVTDHLGRVHEVLPKLFGPTPLERLGTPNPWLMDYTFETLYIRRI